MRFLLSFFKKLGVDDLLRDFDKLIDKLETAIRNHEVKATKAYDKRNQYEAVAKAQEDKQTRAEKVRDELTKIFK